MIRIAAITLASDSALTLARLRPSKSVALVLSAAAFTWLKSGRPSEGDGPKVTDRDHNADFRTFTCSPGNSKVWKVLEMEGVRTGCTQGGHARTRFLEGFLERSLTASAS